MQTIFPPSEFVAMLCGEQPIEKTEYHKSRYWQETSCDGKTLLYHTLTGELLLLAPDEEPERDEALRRMLIRHWFYVPEDFDEHKMAKEVRTIAADMQNKKPGITGFTIFPTTDCNARCRYCYELGRSRVDMSDQMARDAAAYIARVSAGQEVKLYWFGGEPLYNRKAIDIIIDELRQSGIPFNSHITTNGYLFDEALVKTARNIWNLKTVQITLDGTEPVYNRIKAYVDAEGSAFQRVMNNIALLLDSGLKVTIRLNADAENVEDLLHLVDELAQRFGGSSGFSVYAVQLKKFVGGVTPLEQENTTDDKFSLLKNRIAAYGFEHRRKLKRGFINNQCMADNDACVTILPDGHLGRCEHHSEDEFVGDIYEGVTDAECTAAWKETVQIPACKTCVLYPNCIRLTKCPWHADGCTEKDRQNMIEFHKWRIRNTYKEWRDGAATTDESLADQGIEC